MFKVDKKIYVDEGDKPTSGYSLNIPIFDFRVELIFIDEMDGSLVGAVTHEPRSYKCLIELEGTSVGAVIHESVHVAQAIALDLDGGKVSNDTKNELIAYLTDYVACEIFEVIKQRRKDAKN